MSALCRLASRLGCPVSACDRGESEYTALLRAEGIPVCIGHDPAHLDGADTVVFSSAVRSDQPELAEAMRRGLRLLERHEFLGLIAGAFGKTAAVAGTHGKTTTSAMLGEILAADGRDPTVHVGGFLPRFGGNLRLGGQEIFVTEACEYKKSFLSLRPDVAVVTNIDFDHPDCYRDLGETEKAFAAFAGQVRPGGLVLNADDPNSAGFSGISFGIFHDADHRAVLRQEGSGCLFDWFERGEKRAEIRLGAAGLHNVQNALAAAAAARLLGCSADSVKSGLENFEGVRRRFEEVGRFEGKRLISDYAHHPREIKCLIRTAGLSGEKIAAVFQPHTYSRTIRLMTEFSCCFDGLTAVGILPVYRAREVPVEGVEHILCQLISDRGIRAELLSKESTASFIRSCGADTVLMVGAGDIDALARELAARSDPPKA